jgi:hypothetical protein
MSLFAKDKNAICFTNLIIKVKQYHGGSPLFYLEKVINDDAKAQTLIQKLNDVAKIDATDNENEKGWNTQYFTSSLTY